MQNGADILGAKGRRKTLLIRRVKHISLVTKAVGVSGGPRVIALSATQLAQSLSSDFSSSFSVVETELTPAEEQRANKECSHVVWAAEVS